MTTRKSFTDPPVSRKPSAAAIDQFVAGGSGTDRQDKGPVKRLSIDIPVELHTRLKIACTQNNVKMTAELLALVEPLVVKLERRGAATTI